MTSPAVWADARSRIASAGLVPADRIAWPNETFDPPDPTASPAPLWLAVTADGVECEPIELGGGVWEERGAITIAGFAPFGVGVADLFALTKAVAALFRPADTPPEGIAYLGLSTDEGFPDDDGVWFRLTLRVDYRFQDR